MMPKGVFPAATVAGDCWVNWPVVWFIVYIDTVPPWLAVYKNKPEGVIVPIVGFTPDGTVEGVSRDNVPLEELIASWSITLLVMGVP